MGLYAVKNSIVNFKKELKPNENLNKKYCFTVHLNNHNLSRTNFRLECY